MSNKTLSTVILAQNAGKCRCKLTLDDDCGIIELSVKPPAANPLDYDDLLHVVTRLMDQAEIELNADLKPATKQSHLTAGPGTSAKGGSS